MDKKKVLKIVCNINKICEKICMGIWIFIFGAILLIIGKILKLYISYQETWLYYFYFIIFFVYIAVLTISALLLYLTNKLIDSLSISIAQETINEMRNKRMEKRRELGLIWSENEKKI